MEVMHIFLGIFGLSVFIATALFIRMGIKNGIKRRLNPIDKISQLQSWEFVRDLNRNAGKQK
jgi:hypothetical protein